MGHRGYAPVLLAGMGLAVATGQASAQVLSVVSSAPARAHLVAAGTATTFVVSARNRLLVPRTVSVSIQTAPAAAGGWQALLFSADALFRPVGAGSDGVSVLLAAGQS